MEHYSARHTVTLEYAADRLEKYGVCIIPNILTPEECSTSVDNMWEII